MKTLVYASSPDKAREVVRWTTSLAEHIPLDVTLQRIRGAAPHEVEAGAILEKQLSPRDGIRELEIRDRSGAPEEAISAEAREREYSLVAVAPAGRKGFIRLFYGSMVAHVVQRVSTSVLVVRKSPHIPPRKILVCVSGSRHSLTDVSLAAQLASCYKAGLSILMVLSQVSIDVSGTEPWEAGIKSFVESDHPLAAHLRVGGKIAEGLGVSPEIRVRQGLITEEILKETREGDYDLLVLGTHRAEDFDTVYEDITDEVVQAAPVTTLVVGLRAALF